MTTTREAVLAASREHMTKEAGILNRAGARVAGGAARALENIGGGLSSSGIGKYVDSAALRARQSQLISTKANIQGQARAAARASEREAVRTQRAAQSAELRSAKGPQQRQDLRQHFAAAPASPDVVQARQQMAAIGGPKQMSPTPQAPVNSAGARASQPPSAEAPTPVSTSPTAPPPAPTIYAPAPAPAPVPASPLLSPGARRYLMLGGAGIAGGAVIGGGVSGGRSAQQQPLAPPQYPPGY